MKKILSLSLVAILSGSALFAQDTTSMQRKQKKSTDSAMTNPSDTSKKYKNWDNNKMPKDKQTPNSNFPDSMKKRDSL